MNDAQELRFGRAEVRAALRNAADKLSPPGTDTDGPDNSRATIMRSAADHLEPGGMYLRKQAHAVYLACFCEAGDLLSQWRGYGSSGGFAIGFRTSTLSAVQPPNSKSRLEGIEDEDIPEAFRFTPDPVTLVKVNYGESGIQPVVDDVLERIAPEPVAFPGARGFQQAKTVVFPALASIKHAGFSEEREWRLIAMGSVGEVASKFRAGAIGVIPYVELPLPDAAIEVVVIGPGQNPELRKQGVERLLAEHGHEEVVVRRSESPFRG